MREWISVAERLPEKWQNVLTYREEKGRSIEYILSSGRFENDCICSSPVTHWMPLPEPPKEG